MALISMAVYDTVENKRTELTRRTIESLLDTVDFGKHRIVIVDNNSCEETKILLREYESIFNVKHADNFLLITLDQNIGTAKAVNKGWQLRSPGEHCVKMDNDVVIHKIGWLDELEDCLRHDPSIGIIGLKRKDCWENPSHENPFYRSKLRVIPHEPGNPWRIVEDVNHVMGTCQLYNSALLDKIGYLYQPRLYGFDDALAAVRCRVAGFKNCFYPSVEIDHIDPGDTDYQRWKEAHAGQQHPIYNEIVKNYENGTLSIYYEADYQ